MPSCWLANGFAISISFNNSCKSRVCDVGADDDDNDDGDMDAASPSDVGDNLVVFGSSLGIKRNWVVDVSAAAADVVDAAVDDIADADTDAEAAAEAAVDASGAAVVVVVILISSVIASSSSSSFHREKSMPGIWWQGVILSGCVIIKMLVGTRSMSSELSHTIRAKEVFLISRDWAEVKTEGNSNQNLRKESKLKGFFFDPKADENAGLS